jgi:hypothetical protein
VRSSRASIAALGGGALRLQIRLQDVDVVAGLFEALALDGLDSLQQLATIEDRLRPSERVLGARRWVALGEGDTVGVDAESLEIGAGDVEIDLCAVVADLVEQLRVRWVDLVANLWRLGLRFWVCGAYRKFYSKVFQAIG